MHPWLLDVLVDPVSNTPLVLKQDQTDADGRILEGQLLGDGGRAYPVIRGIPRFVVTEDAGQKQTGESFGFKWKQRNTYDSPSMRTYCQSWLVKRYGFSGVEEMRKYFASRKRILDAGCGSGWSSSLWLDPAWGGKAWVGVDVSSAVEVARDRLVDVRETQFVQADILQLPFSACSFDTIFSEGVLHHTPSTVKALCSACSALEIGGEILFYVYRKKGPMREFADDFIRDFVSTLEPQEAWEKLRGLTRLGESLAGLGVEVDVPEDIPYLGIKAGKYNLQRFIYNHFLKLFWNEHFSFEENNHVNFDWYHPRYAHRQTEGEIRQWCQEAGLKIVHLDIEESGFTVRAIKK